MDTAQDAGHDTGHDTRARRVELEAAVDKAHADFDRAMANGRVVDATGHLERAGVLMAELEGV